ncbi:hypothetical protein HDV63DRAFT_376933 [Trichoderma sp. SZMC 28014]
MHAHRMYVCMYRSYSYANEKIQSVDRREALREGGWLMLLLWALHVVGEGSGLVRAGHPSCTQSSPWLEEMLLCSCESDAGGVQVSKQDIWCIQWLAVRVSSALMSCGGLPSPSCWQFARHDRAAYFLPSSQLGIHHYVTAAPRAKKPRRIMKTTSNRRP